MPEMSPGDIGSSVRQLVQATAAVAAFGKVNAQPSDQSPTSRPATTSLPFTARTRQQWAPSRSPAAGTPGVHNLTMDHAACL